MAEQGNAAAMREALEAVFDALKKAYATLEVDRVWLADNIDIITAALAAPPRNCDRFKTWSEAWDAFAAAYFGPTDPGELEYHFGVWLFEPEKGGAQ